MLILLPPAIPAPAPPSPPRAEESAAPAPATRGPGGGRVGTRRTRSGARSARWNGRTSWPGARRARGARRGRAAVEPRVRRMRARPSAATRRMASHARVLGTPSTSSTTTSPPSTPGITSASPCRHGRRHRPAVHAISGRRQRRRGRPGALVTPAGLRLAERQVRDIPAVALGDGDVSADSGRTARDGRGGRRARSHAPSCAGTGWGSASARPPTVSSRRRSPTWRRRRHRRGRGAWWGTAVVRGELQRARAPRAGRRRVGPSKRRARRRRSARPALEETRTRAAFGMSQLDRPAASRLGQRGGRVLQTGRDRTPADTGGVEYWPIALDLRSGGDGARWFAASRRRRPPDMAIARVQEGVWLASRLRGRRGRARRNRYGRAPIAARRATCCFARTDARGGVVDHGVFGRALGIRTARSAALEADEAVADRCAPGGVRRYGEARGAAASSRPARRR